MGCVLRLDCVEKAVVVFGCLVENRACINHQKALSELHKAHPFISHGYCTLMALWCAGVLFMCLLLDKGGLK